MVEIPKNCANMRGVLIIGSKKVQYEVVNPTRW